MYKQMKMSKYNFTVFDPEGNLILYNFLKGLTSLMKVEKQNVNKFQELFLTDKFIESDECKGSIDLVDKMIESGVLVDANANEDILFESKYYEETCVHDLVLTILPTGKCNFNCIYCMESEQNFSRKPMTLESQNAILKYIQKQIHKYKSLRIAWFGGEPLLEPKTIKYLSENIMKICGARYIPYSAQIITNGYTLDADMFDMLYKLKIYTYMITIDGFKEEHDKLRVTHDGKGTYDKIIENLIRIRDNKQYKFAHIVIRVNITTGFLPVLDDFMYYMKSLFGDDPRFAFLFVPAEDYSSDNSDKSIFVDGKTVSSYLMKNDIYMKEFYSDAFKVHLIHPMSGCPSNYKNSYVIAPDLKIYKCCAHFNMSENSIGEINSSGELIIDEELHSRWYLVDRYLNDEKSECQNCFYLPICSKNKKHCPAKYLRSKPIDTFCPKKMEQCQDALVENIIYASNNYQCYIADL